jgi:hypothetical protein
MPGKGNFVKGANGKWIRWENSPEGKAAEQRNWEAGQKYRNEAANERFRLVKAAKLRNSRKVSRKNRKANTRRRR